MVRGAIGAVALIVALITINVSFMKKVKRDEKKKK